MTQLVTCVPYRPLSRKTKDISSRVDANSTCRYSVVLHWSRSIHLHRSYFYYNYCERCQMCFIQRALTAAPHGPSLSEDTTCYFDNVGLCVKGADVVSRHYGAVRCGPYQSAWPTERLSRSLNCPEYVTKPNHYCDFKDTHWHRQRSRTAVAEAAITRRSIGL